MHASRHTVSVQTSKFLRGEGERNNRISTIESNKHVIETEQVGSLESTQNAHRGVEHERKLRRSRVVWRVGPSKLLKLKVRRKYFFILPSYPLVLACLLLYWSFIWLDIKTRQLAGQGPTLKTGAIVCHDTANNNIYYYGGSPWVDEDNLFNASRNHHR